MLQNMAHIANICIIFTMRLKDKLPAPLPIEQGAQRGSFKEASSTGR
jgi:hypothetical protein